MKKRLVGPHGVTLELDSKEIYPDDPGQGTPAMVEYDGGIGSLTCVENEGCVCCDRRGEIPLPHKSLQWLDSEDVQTQVEAMYDAGPDGRW